MSAPFYCAAGNWQNEIYFITSEDIGAVTLGYAASRHGFHQQTEDGLPTYRGIPEIL